MTGIQYCESCVEAVRCSFWGLVVVRQSISSVMKREERDKVFEFEYLDDREFLDLVQNESFAVIPGALLCQIPVSMRDY